MVVALESILFSGYLTCGLQSEADMPEVVQFLSGVPVLKLLSTEQLEELAYAFQVGTEVLYRVVTENPS